MSLPTSCMVFDCESVGLHGETFAVGAVVLAADGSTTEEYLFACDPGFAQGTPSGRAWVADHVPGIPRTCGSPRAVRDRFWAVWLRHRTTCVLVADCAWPVEARFLAACVDDDPEQRTWQGPYPLHELASFMVAAGMEPLKTYDRLPDAPLHDPLGDAKHSARLLVQALETLAAKDVKDAPTR